MGSCQCLGSVGYFNNSVMFLDMWSEPFVSKSTGELNISSDNGASLRLYKIFVFLHGTVVGIVSWWKMHCGLEILGLCLTANR